MQAPATFPSENLNWESKMNHHCNSEAGIRGGRTIFFFGVYVLVGFRSLEHGSLTGCPVQSMVSS